MKKVLIPILLLFLLAGCSSGPAAGIKVDHESCITTNTYGECTISFTSVDKNNTYYFENIALDSDETIFLEMTTTISSGELEVNLINYEGELTSYLVVPDQGMEIRQWVIGDGSEYLPIQFNALNNQLVKDVKISITYTRR